MQLLIYSILAGTTESLDLNKMLTGMKGYAGAQLQAVTFQEVTAVVCEINRNELSPSNPEVIAFAVVIDKLEQNFTLLPMRYGSLLADAESVNAMLERNYMEILLCLLKVENRQEFALKVILDADNLDAELLQEEEPATGPKGSFTAAEVKISAFREYVNRKLIVHRREEMLLKQAESLVRDINAHFSRMNSICQFKKTLSSNTIIDAVFLLEKSRKNELVEAIRDLQERNPGMSIALTGPWPPYSFVEITLQ